MSTEALATERRKTGISTAAITASLVQYSKVTLFFLAIGLIWEIAVGYLRLMPDYILPAPSQILRVSIAQFDRLLFHAGITTVEIVIGFVVGSLIGIVGAVLTVYSRFFQQVIYPATIVTQTVPKLAIAPLFVVWFGFGIVPKVLIVAIMCLFPVLINSVIGFTSVDNRLLDLMHSLSASRWQVFCKIRLPHAVPYIFAGLKIGITLAVVGGIVGEWVGSDAGLGYYVQLASASLETARLFAALVFITLVGIGLFLAVVLLEWLVSPRRHVAIEGREGM
jgi:NitT/TauT family transport system permease protein